MGIPDSATFSECQGQGASEGEAEVADRCGRESEEEPGQRIEAAAVGEDGDRQVASLGFQDPAAVAAVDAQGLEMELEGRADPVDEFQATFTEIGLPGVFGGQVAGRSGDPFELRRRRFGQVRIGLPLYQAVQAGDGYGTIAQGDFRSLEGSAIGAGEGQIDRVVEQGSLQSLGLGKAFIGGEAACNARPGSAEWVTGHPGVADKMESHACILSSGPRLVKAGDLARGVSDLARAGPAALRRQPRTWAWFVIPVSVFVRVPLAGIGYTVATMASHQRGFTLVELLVVIAILAILAALLLPGLQIARSAALQTKCMSNMRQIGMGVEAYTGDWEGFLPATEMVQANGKSVDWYVLLAPYIVKDVKTDSNTGATRSIAESKESVIWGCPANPYLKDRIASWGGANSNGYGLNANLGLPDDTRTAHYPAAPWPQPQVLWNHAAVTYPSDRPLIGDTTGKFLRTLTPNRMTDSRAAARHRGKAVYLFCDLHVGVLNEAQACQGIRDPSRGSL